MLLALVSMLPPSSSAFLALSESLPVWIWALIMKSTKLSRSQRPAAAATHLAIRFQGMRRSPGGGAGAPGR
jgi:hypothetical protein